MPTEQGSIALLNEPLAQELLHSTIPARLAYIGGDGAPRAVPIWFHWNGAEIVLGSPLKAPKVKALLQNPKVALTIDTNTMPHKVLQVRGTVKVETVEGVVPEYALAAHRYFGEQQGQAWVEQIKALFPQMARITVRPEWVSILDFEKRFPSAIEAAMAG
ncbi:MAG: pyridoxamine 5'-phosphate oxidase family protein [Acidobacteriota bacterium]|nr:pyridoxamine 5'-phosphate oxidase family protein [Acidobacteriota bacterium]